MVEGSQQLFRLHRDIEALVDRLSQPEPGSQQLLFESEHAQSLIGQYCVLLRKGTVSYWRNPGYNAVRFTFTVVYGVLMGAAFWGLGSNRCATSHKPMSCATSLHNAGYGLLLACLLVHMATPCNALCRNSRTLVARTDCV